MFVSLPAPQPIGGHDHARYGFASAMERLKIGCDYHPFRHWLGERANEAYCLEQWSALCQQFRHLRKGDA